MIDKKILVFSIINLTRYLFSFILEYYSIYIYKILIFHKYLVKIH